MFWFSLLSGVKGRKLKAGITFPVLAISLAVLIGCTTDLEDIDDTNYPGTMPLLLVGEWGYPSEGYVITEETLNYNSSGSYEDGDGITQYYDYSFAGDICFVSNFDSKSGVIIIEYTSPPPDPDPTRPFTAVYYRNLTGNSVQLANVVNLGDYSSADTETREKAISKFTRGNMPKYVDWSYVLPQTKIDP